MNILRFFEIILKLSLCLSFRKFFAVRIVLFPFHAVFMPRILIMTYNQRLAFVLESLGGIFIKLGQSLSLKSFLFSKETLKTLSYLQDSLPPMPLDVIAYLKKINPNLLSNSTFEVNPTPIASASIAQIYKGKLGGEDIILKIVKPLIKEKIEQDFTIILFIAKIVNVFCSPALQIVDVVQNIHEGVLQELNLEQEARNIREIKRTLILEPCVHLPSVFDEYLTMNCLVMSFCEGISLRKVIHGNVRINKNTVAKNVLEAYLKQVYQNGIFNADMHSGNILVQKDGTIALIDFGLICKISIQDRRTVAGLIHAFLKNDANLAVKIQLEAKYIPEHVFFNHQYHLAMREIAQKFSSNFNMSDFASDLFRVMHKFNVFVPKHLLLLNKTILYIEDIVQQLSPSFKALDVIQPWIQKWYYKEKVKMFADEIYSVIKERRVF